MKIYALVENIQEESFMGVNAKVGNKIISYYTTENKANKELKLQLAIMAGEYLSLSINEEDENLSLEYLTQADKIFVNLDYFEEGERKSKKLPILFVKEIEVK